MPRPIDCLLGRLAVEVGLLTRAQVDAALRIQQSFTPPPPLGVVFLEAGLLNHEQLARLLAHQRESDHRTATAVPAADWVGSYRFGVLAVRMGFVAPGVVNEALREQARREDAGMPWTRLGEILEQAGRLTRAQVGAVLAAQSPGGAEPESATRPGPRHEDTRVPRRPPDATEQRKQAVVDPGVHGTAAPPVPSRLGKYELTRPLGAGGMGIVYLAYHPGLHSFFAVKVLRSGIFAAPEELKRFEREAHVLGRLRHPGIVRVCDAGVESGQAYLAMEYVEGANLSSVLDDPSSFDVPVGPPRVDRAGEGFDRRGGIAAVAAVGMVRKIAEALQFAHEAGVVHRDLKPANVIREPGGTLKVMDFGLAKPDGAGEAVLTQSGMLTGTPAYMSPEQAQARVGELDARSDVYQVGAILYEMLTGRPPYLGESPLAVAMKVAQEDPPPPRRVAPGVDPDAETICLKAMAREKHLRYASAGDLAEDCRRYLEEEGIRARPPKPWEPALRWCRRRPLLVGALGVALAATLAFGRENRRARIAAEDRAREQSARAEAEQEQARLREAMLAALRERADLYLDAALRVRRAGAPLAEVEDYRQQLQQAAAEAIAREPRRPEPHYHLGRLSRALLFLEDAVRHQDAALALDPSFAPSRYERAVLLLIRSFDLAAERVWDFPPAEVPGTAATPGAHAARAAAVDPRIADLRRRIRADLGPLVQPALPGAAPSSLPPAIRECARGIFAYAAEEEAERATALAHLERASTLAPTLDEARICRAQIQIDAGDPAGCIRTCTEGLARDQGQFVYLMQRAHARRVQAVLAAARGEPSPDAYPAALADVTEILRLYPRPEFLALRAALLWEWGRGGGGEGRPPEVLWAEALADLERALALFPNLMEARCRRSVVVATLARVRWQRGDDPEPLFALAAEDLDHAVRLAADDPMARALRADLFRVRGEWSIARGEDPTPSFRRGLEESDRAIRLRPDLELGLMARADLLEAWIGHGVERGRDPGDLVADALIACDRVLELHPSSSGGWRCRGRIALALMRRDLALGKSPVAHGETAVAALTNALGRRARDASALTERARARLELGRARVRCGEDPAQLLMEAEADLARAAQIEPTDGIVWVGRAELDGLRGEYLAETGGDPGPGFENALEHAARAAALQPGSIDPWLTRGTLALSWARSRIDRGEDPTGAFDQAIASAEFARARAPLRADAWRCRGRARGDRVRFRGDSPVGADSEWATAGADLDRAVELDPDLAESRTVRAHFRLEWGRAVAEAGQDPAKWFQGAREDLDHAVARAPEQAFARIGRSNLFRVEGQRRAHVGLDPTEDYRRAWDEIQQAIRCAPQSPLARIVRADLAREWARVRSGRGEDPTECLSQAMRDAEELLRRFPERGEAWGLRGKAHSAAAQHEAARGREARSHREAALADFDQALHRMPFSWEIRLHRGVERLNRAREGIRGGEDPAPGYAAAAVDLLQAGERNPGDPEIWLNLAILRDNQALQPGFPPGEAQRLWREALEFLDRAIDRRPAAANLWSTRGCIGTNLGVALGEAGSDPVPTYRSALADLDRALGLAPSDPRAWIGRADLQQNWGAYRRNRGEDPDEQFSAARADYGEALRLRPGNLEALFGRGILNRNRAMTILAQGGDALSTLEAALRDLEEVVARDPADSLAREQIPGLQYNLGCLLALRSVGRVAPGAEAREVEATEAAAWRDRAFARLEAAIQAGWSDRAHLEADSDLAPLRADPRWAELLAQIEGR